MKNKILIGEFVKLTGSTIKTVLYYHKIGLLKEPTRLENGYRLYGAEELAQMRIIKHFKNLGLDLKQIKEILKENKTNKKGVLKSLHQELLKEKNNIEVQIAKVEKLLSEESENTQQTCIDSNLFNDILDTLDEEQVKSYKEINHNLYNQQRNVFGVIDDFNWDKDYKENFKEIAEYFKLNPDKYKVALDFGKRLAKLKEMSEDDPEIEKLAHEGAEFIIQEPILKNMLYGKDGLDDTNESLLNEMTNKFLSPAQIKHKKLIQKHLKYKK